MNELWIKYSVKLLGLLQGVVATLAATTGAVPVAHLPYYLGASAVLTVLGDALNDMLIAKRGEQK